jgi:hypothetical protein
MSQENDLLTKTLCEQEEAYKATKGEMCESTIETKPLEAFNSNLLDRELEHRLVLSAWHNLRQETLNIKLQHIQNQKE